jgi:hypothetical protein
VERKVAEMDARIKAERFRSDSNLTTTTITRGEPEELRANSALPPADHDTLSIGRTAPTRSKLEKLSANLADAQGVLRTWAMAADEDQFLLDNDLGAVILCLACDAIDIATAWELKEVHSTTV